MFVAQVPKFSQGDQTLYDLVAAIYGSSVGEMIEELLHYLYSSPAHLLQGENSDYIKQQEDRMFYVDFNTFHIVFHK